VVGRTRLRHTRLAACPFDDAPPAIPPPDAAHRESRGLGPAPVVRLRDRRRADGRLAMGDGVLCRTRAFIRREGARRSTR
jgi:hypothetical protein